MEKATTNPAPVCWQITPSIGSTLPLLITNWHLESPRAEEQSPYEDILEIRGWALTAPEKQRFLHLVIQYGPQTLSFPMNVDRPDVIAGVIGQDAQDHPQLRCGFRYALPLDELIGGLSIGFETDLEIHVAAKIDAQTQPQAVDSKP